REWYAKYVDSAVEVPSPAFDRLCETAKANDVLLHVGIIEKAGGTLYCTALLLDREGKLVYKHRKVTQPIHQAMFETNKLKLIPTAAERLVWGRGAGDGLLVKPTDVGRLGELYAGGSYGDVPAGHRARGSVPVSKGETVADVDNPHSIGFTWRPTPMILATWTASMQHVAKEGRCFVVSVNSFCKVSDFPPDYPPFTAEHPDRRPDGAQWEADDILNHGGSCIVGPLGTFLAEPAWDKEEIVYASLRMADITESKLDFDPIGSYSRPDIFQTTLDVMCADPKLTSRLSSLTVNAKPADNVVFTS
ncbi:carbon-nitrogen hydrolase, partial [Colletotrichum cuscutae]